LDLLAALRFLPGPKKPEILILGVEPKIIDFGVELTAEVQTALPQLVRISKGILAQWGLVPPTHEKRPDSSPVNSPDKAGLLL
jgi:hydrogenase maturation protease